jgi:glycosyltransferase involved in cell wall biosynthesis
MEAAARGTPIVAYARGSAPELIIDGVTGILCADEAEMVAAIPKAMGLDPSVCRAHAASLCDRDVIARQHLECYRQILEGKVNGR